MQNHSQSSKTVKLFPISGQKKPVEWKTHLVVYLKECIELIKIDDIIYLKSDSNYCHIYLKDQRKLLTSQTLKHFSEKLDPEKFIRIHQSYIVRKANIKTYFHREQNLLLTDGNTLPVSRKQKPLLFDFFASYKC